MNMQLVIIDPQNDFVLENGNLPVAGAKEDGNRLAKYIKNNIKRLDDIHVTLDSHHRIHIAHPHFWKNKRGKHPIPFEGGKPTLIYNEDIRKKEWLPTNPNVPVLMPDGSTKSLLEWVLYYTEQLEQKSKYVLCIWPEHCLIAQPGFSIYTPIAEALDEWETTRFGVTNILTKGSNFLSEHYGGLQAEVVVPSDPGTGMNKEAIETIEEADLVPLAGWASSHCLKATLEQIVDAFGDEVLKKIVLLEDATSPVPGFETMAADFIMQMKDRGMQVARTTDYLF